MVAQSRKSNLFFLGFSAVCLGGCAAAAVGLQALTNPGTVDLGGSSKKEPENARAAAAAAQLLRQGRPDAALIGKVNTARLGQMLEEIEKKENTEDRYKAALRGETLLGTPKTRHLASGSSAGLGAGAGSGKPPQHQQ